MKTVGMIHSSHAHQLYYIIHSYTASLPYTGDTDAIYTAAFTTTNQCLQITQLDSSNDDFLEVIMFLFLLKLFGGNDLESSEFCHWKGMPKIYHLLL